MAYLAGDHLIRAVMTAGSGLVEDQVVNDFAFCHDAGAPTDSEIEDIMEIVGDFYRLGATAADRVGSYISNGVDRSATHRIEAYKIVVGPLGSPVGDMAWLGPVAASSSNNLPTECAGVLSFHADLFGVPEESGATRPKARRRGRVFIGPLILEATNFALDSPTLHSDFTAALRSNATGMFDAAEAAGWSWRVWSRADVVTRPVVGGWTDNAVDIQRRRGTAASSRTTFST